MERLQQTAQFIKKEAVARTTGAILVGIGGQADLPPHYESLPARPTALVRTIEEMQVPRFKNTLYTFIGEIKNIDRIRNDFDIALKVDTKNKLLSWDPVKSRNRYEQCTTEEEVSGYLQNEFKEITSTLRERYNCAESPMDFFIDQAGFLRNREFPAETLETILERGVAYQQTHGSKELERERSEVIGIKKLQAHFADPSTEIGSTMLIFSPPGMVEGTPYTKKFVDKYVLKEDEETGQRIIEAKRYVTAMSSEEYQQAALALDPQYFNGEEGPLDAVLLRKPIKIEGIGDCAEILDRILTFDPDALRGYEFQMLDMICEPLKPFLIQAIINWDPQTIARTLNSLLHLGDQAEKLLAAGDMEGLAALLAWSRRLDSHSIGEEIRRRGLAPIQERAVGCGVSGGFDNSVGQFGFNAENDPNLCKKCPGFGAHFHCPGTKQEEVKKDGKVVKKDVSCSEKIRVGKGITRCPTCGEGKKC